MFLKITPTTSIGRVGKVKKLSPHFLGLFQILKRVGSVAYQMALPPSLSNLHDVFRMSQLRKHHSDPSQRLDPESIQLKEELTFNLPPSQIMDHGVK